MSSFADLEQELNDATARAQQLVASTEPRLFTVRPNLSAWSASECLAHLSISSEMFIPVLRDAIADARKRGMTSEKKPSMDLLGRILRWFMEPPVRSRLKTSAPFVPKSVRAKAEALNEFVTLQRQLVDLLRDAEHLALSRMKIVSPFDKRVRYNVYSAFRIIAAHQRRHLWQAEQAVAALLRRAA
ncbi:MAG TPA: DinB family protein [Thermoanaerobaculia bacterium]|nr:DinB family protein [Thermoanaerobaculia bacterium]